MIKFYIAAVALCLCSCQHSQTIDHKGLETEIKFKSSDIVLTGSLRSIPRDHSDLLCVFIPGSFPQTRDGNLDSNNTKMFPVALPKRNLFLDLANALEQVGVSSFRYDKRGSGTSGGDFDKATLNDLVTDVENAISHLKANHGFLDHRICLVGQSEGARIAAMVAARNPDINLVLLQGGGFNLLKSVTEEQKNIFNKKNDEQKNFMLANMPWLYHFYRQFDDFWKAVKMRKNSFLLGDSSWSYNVGLTLYQEHQQIPLREIYPKVKAKIFILHGMEDVTVPVSEAFAAYNFLTLSKKDVCIKTFPGLDHSFRKVGQSKKGLIEAMKDPISPDFIGYFKSIFADKKCDKTSSH